MRNYTLLKVANPEKRIFEGGKLGGVKCFDTAKEKNVHYLRGDFGKTEKHDLSKNEQVFKVKLLKALRNSIYKAIITNSY